MIDDEKKPQISSSPKLILVSVAIYSISGAISGTIAGGVGWGLSYLVHAVRGHGFLSNLQRWFVPEIADCLIPGVVIGFLGGMLTRFLIRARPAAKHPVYAGVFWASLAGSCSLFAITIVLLFKEPVEAGNVLFLLLNLVGHIILAGVYGFLLAALALVAENGLARKKSTPENTESNA